jgi:hypothetical protein
MPTTSLRPLRGAPPAEPASASRPAAQPPGHRPRAADEVYGFLSSFTAGVQRGLDAARSGNTGGEDAGGRR